MTTETTTNRVDDSGQGLYLLLLIICASLVAIGISITIFGSTSKFLPELTVRLATVGTGILTMAIGSGGGYRLLT